MVYSQAKIYALAGDDVNAIQSLYRAKDLGMTKKESLLNEPSFNSLKHLDQFKQLVNQLE